MQSLLFCRGKSRENGNEIKSILPKRLVGQRIVFGKTRTHYPIAQIINSQNNTWNRINKNVLASLHDFVSGGYWAILDGLTENNVCATKSQSIIRIEHVVYETKKFWIRYYCYRWSITYIRSDYTSTYSTI